MSFPQVCTKSDWQLWWSSPPVPLPGATVPTVLHCRRCVLLDWLHRQSIQSTNVQLTLPSHSTLEPRHEVLWWLLELRWLSGWLSLRSVVELVYWARKGRLRSFVRHVLSAEHAIEDPLQNRRSPSWPRKCVRGNVFLFPNRFLFRSFLISCRLYCIFWDSTKTLSVIRRATSKCARWATCRAKWYVKILSVTPVTNMSLLLQCMSGWVPCQCKATVVPPEVSLLILYHPCYF